MDSTILQFQGAQDRELLALLLAAVMTVLAAVGVVRVAQRRWREALLCLSAVAGPAGLAVALLAVYAVRRIRGGRGARRALAGAIGAAALGAGAVAAYVLTGRAPTMFWMLAVGVEVALAVGVFYNAVYAQLGRWRMLCLMALRCAGIAALLLILFKPALSFVTGSEAGKLRLSVVVDRSGSMATSDDPSLPDRYSQALQQLSYQRGRIEKSFRPAWGDFARTLQPRETLEAMAALKPSGEWSGETNLARAIREAAGQFSRGESAGVLLISDGIHNAAEPVDSAAAEAGVPVYAAGIGSTNKNLAQRRNVAIQSVDAPLEAVRNNVSTVVVRARASSMADVPLQCQLFDEDNPTPLASDTRSIGKGGEVSFELKWTPAERALGAATSQGSKNDLRRLRVAVTPQPGESTVEDNQASVHVLVTEPRIRVLYIEGTMRPEYKDLKRLLETDSNVQYMGLIQIQPRRFWVQGGVEGQRLTGLPTSEAQFNLFDVIILGDLDRTYLSNDQVEKLAQWVNRGGGLLMIGGHNSFGPGGYGGTALEEVLPVTMGGRGVGQETTAFVPQLTAAGRAHPVLEGIVGFFFGPGGSKPDDRLPELPPLLGCVNTAAAKNGASVLAVHPSRRNESGPLVVLAVQNYGAGRTAAFTADTTWQWNLRLRALGKDSPYQRFWGQLVRYLANTDTKGRNSGATVLLRADRSYVQAGQTLEVLARVQDDRGSGAGGVNVSCAAAPEDPKQTSEAVAVSSREDKMYGGPWRPTKPGKYRLKVTAADAHGATLATDELTVTVAAHAAELDRLDRNDELLQRVAQRSGGKYADISRLPELIDAIARRGGQTAPGPQTRDVRLYNFPLLFGAFACLVTAEWLLRRRWQLQ